MSRIYNKHIQTRCVWRWHIPAKNRWSVRRNGRGQIKCQRFGERLEEYYIVKSCRRNGQYTTIHIYSGPKIKLPTQLYFHNNVESVRATIFGRPPPGVRAYGNSHRRTLPARAGWIRIYPCSNISLWSAQMRTSENAMCTRVVKTFSSSKTYLRLTCMTIEYPRRAHVRTLRCAHMCPQCNINAYVRLLQRCWVHVHTNTI